MPPSNESRARFEEQAALEELERLRRALEQSRQRRKQANEEFDTFLRSFQRRPDPPAAETPAEEPRTPRYARPPDPRPREVPEPPPPAPLTRRPDRPAIEEPPQTPAAAPVAVGRAIEPYDSPLMDLPSEVPPTVEARSPEIARSVEQPRSERPESARDAAGALEPGIPLALPTTEEQPSQLRNPRMLAVFALLAILGVFFAARALAPDGPPPPPPESAAGQAPAQAAPAAPPADRTAGGNRPAIAESTGVQLTTIRRVWVRVTADGVKTLERELPADARIPIAAKDSIVIRAGDAGAVRLVIGGKDQGPFGPDGVVRTRAFTPPR
jgi:hypothetical protein